MTTTAMTTLTPNKNLNGDFMIHSHTDVVLFPRANNKQPDNELSERFGLMLVNLTNRVS